MRNVLWTPSADRDREDIWDYVSAENIRAAIKLDELFESSSVALSENPSMGKQGIVSGTHELVIHKHYRLIYEFDQKTVYILTLLHTSREYP